MNFQLEQAINRAKRYSKQGQNRSMMVVQDALDIQHGWYTVIKRSEYDVTRHRKVKLVCAHLELV